MAAMVTTRQLNMRILIVLGLISMLGVQRLSAQAEMRRPQIEAEQTFFFDAITYTSDQGKKSRIDIYVQVPYQEVRFYKEGDQFLARYEITLNILTPSQQSVLERSWNVDVRVDNFAQTTSSKLYSLSQRTVDVEPGQYQINVQIRDFESQKTSQVKKALLVTDFHKDSLSLSDIMLVNRLTTEGDKKNIVPNISGNVGRQTEGFFIFFEIYKQADLDSVELTWKVMNLKQTELFKNARIEPVPTPKTQAFLKIENLNLPMGTYVLTVDAVDTKRRNEKDTLSANTSRTFYVRSGDLPVAILDLDKAVDQLMYIAQDGELQYIREAKEEEERHKRFLEFWAKRDPDPQTSRNELMEEYYQRVDYANKNFTHYLEGWKTDMGMVYIRFGSPENVERHPFDQDAKPYEIWYYYQLNRQFIFVDETGFGDYRLRYPTTDLWGRIR